MALITEPTYSTFEQFGTYTPRASQKDGGADEVAEGSWTPVAIFAQYLIDENVSRFACPPYDEAQDSAFPTSDEDGDSWIPDDITLAHIHLTSFLIAQGDPAVDSRQVQSETWSGTGYSKTYAGADSQLSIATDEMPAFVRKILAKYGSNAAPATY